MIYEVTIQYSKIDQKGNEKSIKEKYLVENIDFHAEAENKLYQEMQGLNDLDVVAVKRSKIREFVNARQNDDDRIFVADVADIRTNDDGEEVQLIYKVAVFAMNFDAAKSALATYLQQGFDMELVGLKCTKFIDLY